MSVAPNFSKIGRYESLSHLTVIFSMPKFFKVTRVKIVPSKLLPKQIIAWSTLSTPISLNCFSSDDSIMKHWLINSPALLTLSSFLSIAIMLSVYLDNSST